MPQDAELLGKKASGWSRGKRVAFEQAFYDYLDYCEINSKDHGEPIILGKHLMYGQRVFITAIFDGLEQDIHDFYCLKSRQLGITTIIRALCAFFLGVHRGLTGALVFDTNENKNLARDELVTIIKALPAKLKFPAIAKDNRDGLTLANSSKILFKSAGIKKTKTSGTLGRSAGVSLAHLCMLPGTPVIVGNGKISKIEDVRVGDQVLTHTGAIANVIANVGRLNFSSLRRITPWLGQSITCTLEHKIPTARGLIPAGDLNSKDVVLMPIRTITREQEFSVLPSNRPKHKGRVSAGSEAIISLDEEVGFAVGYYLAEGSICYQRRDEKYYEYPSGIIFSRHQKEKAYADRAIAALVKFTTGSRGTVEQKDSLTVTETIYSAALARWMESNFGAQDDKIIPDKVFKWGMLFCRGLLTGLLCGDGSKTVNYAQKYPVSCVRLTTTRSSIAMQARDLAASLGYGWAYWSEKEAGLHYGRNCKTAWTIIWNGRCAAGLRALMGLSAIKSKGHTYSEKFAIGPGVVGLKIRKIEDGIASQAVYDLSVDHIDHTFRTPSMAVSNSELCSYDNEEGLISFQESLSDINPNRLYIRESTARGHNLWKRLWAQAREDTRHCVCVFIGWWAKESHRIERTDRDWEFYGAQVPTKDEQTKIDTVKKLYNFEVSQEQLAWYRRAVDPAASDDGDIDAGFEANSFQKQEQPWDEEEAFQITGSVFFAGEKLKDQTDKYISRKFTPYMFMGGSEFSDMKVYKAENARMIELKVWEPPQPESVYVISCDPAFGENENNDRSAIQVLRCYADGVDQVAEYAYPLVVPRHLAHILAGIMAWYGNEPLCEVHYILEINGPGGSVLQELRSLKFQIENGYAPLEDQGIKNIFRNVKQYLYTRPDSLTGGTGVLHFKTQLQTKIMIMEELRGFVGSGHLHIRSHDLIGEMQTIARDGDTIEGEGSGEHDDRVVAMALATHYWDTRIRRQLIVQKRTREAEKVKKQRSIVDQVALYNQNMMASFMGQQKQGRLAQQRLAMKNAWRYGR